MPTAFPWLFEGKEVCFVRVFLYVSVSLHVYKGER